MTIRLLFRNKFARHFQARATAWRWQPREPRVSKKSKLEQPDVILLDLRLPDQSGLEVYQQIRSIDARIPVIFVTVAKGANAAIEAMKEGAYDYLFKPLDLNQLKRDRRAKRLK